MSFVLEHFVPVRVHVRDQAAEYRRLAEVYDQHWTPTILLLDPEGEERYRIEGFLPVDDLMPQLLLGLGHAAFGVSKFAEAEGRFGEVLDRYPNSDVAAEALYWKGVSRYKATDDASALTATAREFSQRYRGTPWAKKASVWAA